MLLPFFSFAQSNFKPGYVVDLKGDTLKGNIDYREWEKNPRQVSFKSNAGAVAVYTPQNARAFAVTGLEYYEKYIVRSSQDPSDITKLGGVADTTSRIDTVFLHTLIKGRYLSLYSYLDDIKARYYILEPGENEPTELAYHSYIDANGSVKHINRYRIQLQNVAQKNNVNNTTLTGLLSQSEYSEHDLLRIAAAINGSDPAQFMNKSQFGTRFFAGAGIDYNDMVFNGDITFADNYAIFPKISGGIDLLTNKNTQQLIFRVEISLTGDQHNFNDTHEQSQLKVTQYTASLVPQVYYNFYNSQKLKIFGGGGVGVNFSAYPDHYYTTIGGINASPIKQANYPDYHMVWESWIVKAGVILDKKVELYVGYSPGSTLTDNYVNFTGSVTSYQAGVNFLFGAK